MSFAAQYAAQAYAKVGLETGVSSADPHRLILMLFEGAQVAIADARRYMETREIARKGESISKAIQIIEEGLMASLDVTKGGPLAQNLKALYEYMSRRLLLAGAKNDVAVLDEVRKLLGELKQAWESIPLPPGAGAAKASVAPATTRPY